ncbi:hypothetical protein VM1G_11346 [Cytospora mali]|uniref:Uncharacterized protein n=1 Tax=Cytospora mali TaxID=578113 RepID=A0A194VLV1_CYTMA|nr:hypothetical protein VM1G_11346 [Valsa mali]
MSAAATPPPPPPPSCSGPSRGYSGDDNKPDKGRRAVGAYAIIRDSDNDDTAPPK